ncbi:MAG: DUF1553 domain-containing protein [Verrucomicrobia bacterium]|nr:DUF1553 domain-containing protein [Verrucomicrobiota bacterium]
MAFRFALTNAADHRLPGLGLVWSLVLAFAGVVRASNPAAAPNTAPPPAAHPHWAFQPAHGVEPPRVSNSRWVRTSVDPFILAGLESAGLEPSIEADKRTLLRRITYDLIGLPPTWEEVRAFELDRSPRAFEKVVERLLNSPHYGERWGRYWLDVARYADTKGYVFEEERRFPYSYTYRDYVIRAFNEDLPYDRFLTEQIAADLLDLGTDQRPLAALGFLTLGRRFLNNMHDIIDDRIDVVMRGTQGLTVTCARCHDHKYDPVSIKDYYGLHGIFASSQEPADKPLLGSASLPSEYPAFKKERDRRQEEHDSFKKSKEEEALSEVRARTGDYWLAAFDGQHLTDSARFESLVRERKLDPGVSRRWRDTLKKWTNNPPSHPLAKLWLQAIQTAGTNREASVAQLVQDQTRAWPEGWLKSGLIQPAPASLADLAKQCSQIFTRLEQAWKKESNGNPKSPTLSDPEQSALRQLLTGDGSPAVVPPDEIRRLFDVPSAQKVRRLKRQIEELEATHPGSPPKAMALVDNPSPRNSKVLLRGNPGNPGPEAPRQFPSLLQQPSSQPFSQGSGRLELARSIASTNNPLTARVFVNRVWNHLFGLPLVETSGDFGLRSSPPSHPELLDHLAWRFMQEGWSVKKLHRTIVLSSAYRQTSDVRKEGQQVDPSNRLLWRAHRRRLDLEAMRDGVLAVSGRLDPKSGGQSVELLSQPFSGRRSVYGFIERQNLPGFFRTFDFASPDTTSAKRFTTTVPQQALFLLNSPFIAEQARALARRLGEDCRLAGPAQTVEEARNLPKALRNEKGCTQDEERVRHLYRLVFQREPSRAEIEMGQTFLDEPLANAKPPAKPAAKQGGGEKDKKTIPPPEPLDAWSRYTQALLVSNEFFFLD